MATTSSNISDLTNFFTGFNKDRNKTEQKHKQTQLKALGDIKTSGVTNERLQTKLLKLSKIDIAFDTADFFQDRKAYKHDVQFEGKLKSQHKTLRNLKKGQSDRFEAESEKAKKLQSITEKTEEHGSINNDLLARIEIVLVTRFDRILDGMKMMLGSQSSFEGSKFGIANFAEALDKVKSIENSTILKGSLDDLRYTRMARKNKREEDGIEADQKIIDSLKKQNRLQEAERRQEELDRRKERRKEKELQNEGRDREGNLLSKRLRGYGIDKLQKHQKLETPFHIGGPGIMGGGIFGGSPLAGGSGDEKKEKTRVTKTKAAFLRLGKMFLKGGLIGAVVYSIVPFLDRLQSPEFGEKVEKLMSKDSPLSKNLTKINEVFTKFGKILGTWLPDVLLNLFEGTVDVVAGFSEILSGNFAKGLQQIIIGKDGKGGLITALGNIVISLFKAVVVGLGLQDMVPTLLKNWLGIADKEVDLSTSTQYGEPGAVKKRKLGQAGKETLRDKETGIYYNPSTHKIVNGKKLSLKKALSVSDTSGDSNVGEYTVTSPEIPLPKSVESAVLSKEQAALAKELSEDTSPEGKKLLASITREGDVHNITNIATVPPRTQANPDVQVARNP
jgi:hypothetical protein